MPAVTSSVSNLSQIDVSDFKVLTRRQNKAINTLFNLKQGKSKPFFMITSFIVSIISCILLISMIKTRRETSSLSIKYADLKNDYQNIDNDNRKLKKQIENEIKDNQEIQSKLVRVEEDLEEQTTRYSTMKRENEDLHIQLKSFVPEEEIIKQTEELNSNLRLIFRLRDMQLYDRIDTHSPFNPFRKPHMWGFPGKHMGWLY